MHKKRIRNKIAKRLKENACKLSGSTGALMVAMTMMQAQSKIISIRSSSHGTPLTKSSQMATAIINGYSSASNAYKEATKSNGNDDIWFYRKHYGLPMHQVNGE